MMNEKLNNLITKKKLRVAGLMSGTSADGIDVAIAELDGKTVNLLVFDMFPYTKKVRQSIFELFSPTTSHVDTICHMNFVLGELFADALIRLANKNKISLSSIDLIGSHGQTIFHIPQGRPFEGKKIRSTLQIGEPSIIAERTGITTVADFRPRDIAAGGEGAPLVPFADYLLFSHKKKNRALQNIGGIANITWLKAGGSSDDILAFDTGPGNMIIDQVTSLVTNGRKKYDAGGMLAAQGHVNEKMLNELMKNPYFKRKPPKTTGRELFGLGFTNDLYDRSIKKGLAPLDILATVTAFTAHSIADASRRFLPAKIDEMILCGGGSWNKTLIQFLQAKLPQTKVATMSDFGINPDAKEAISFAMLAYATIKGIPNNVPSATGAKKNVVLGKIIP
jgi:anhydro-N-acetylmuramic acid kinase